MSFDTQKNWWYELYGRYIHLWQWVESAATDTLGSYRIKLPSEYYGKQLIYPDEDITNGLRVEYTALYRPFITEAIETKAGVQNGHFRGGDLTQSVYVLDNVSLNTGITSDNYRGINTNNIFTLMYHGPPPFIHEVSF